MPASTPAHWSFAFRRNCIRAGLGLALGGASAPGAFAFQPLITDDTGTQGRGGNQLEAAVYRQRYAISGETQTTYAYPVVYTRGVTDSLDAYAVLSHVRVQSASADGDARGSGNPILGLKWRAWEDPDRKLSIGVKPEIAFGVSDGDEARDLGTGRTSYGATALLTQETSFGAVHVNLVANRIRYSLPENREFHREWLYRLSAAPVFEIHDQWKIALDVGVTTHPHQRERARMGYAELGTIWSPGKDLDLAFGYVAFFGDGEQRLYALTAGVTWRFR